MPKKIFNTRKVFPAKFKINKGYLYVKFPLKVAAYLDLNPESDLHFVPVNGQISLTVSKPISIIPLMQDKKELFVPQKD